MVTPEPHLAQQGAGAAPATGVVPVLTREFTAADITDVRHDLRRHAQTAGLHDDALDDFVAAVNELVTNAVRHGGGQGSLRLTLEADTLVAAVSDRGAGFSGELPMAAGPPPADIPGGRGIMLARRLTDTLMITAGPDGVTVTVTRCLSAPATAPPRQ